MRTGQSSMRRHTGYLACTLIALMTIGSWAAEQTPAPQSQLPRMNVNVAPVIPKMKRTENLVFLEKAEEMLHREGESYIIVKGNVEFRKGGMYMFTDSAHYYEGDGSFNAFGNVRMEQGDTLFIYGDELNYNGTTDIANLFGHNGKDVTLINRDVKLVTDVFTYNMQKDLCYYTTGGVMTDRDNRLQSVRGEYSPSTKEANVFDNVILTSRRRGDEVKLVNNSLYYNTRTRVAEFHVPTVITNKDGSLTSPDGVYNTQTGVAEFFAPSIITNRDVTITSQKGVYNTQTGIAETFGHSLVKTKRGSTLEGDTLFYDRELGIGQAWGNMVLIDTARHAIIMGNYGYYDEVIDSAFVTGDALGMEFSKGDTMYIHGRYMTSVLNINKKTRVLGVDTVYTPSETIQITDADGRVFDSVPPPKMELVQRTEEYVDSSYKVSAWPRVRIFRKDVQGLCDSLVFTQTDSMVRMFYHPIAWSDNRQIFGNRIDLHFNDSTIETATLPDFGFLAQQIEDKFFNQMTGRQMKAWFDENGELYRTLVEGSVEGIVFPEENDSTINKLVNFKTGNLDGYYEKDQMKRMKMWAETSGEAIPLYLAKYTDLHLPQFKWYIDLRPNTPIDIFYISPEMDQMMSDHINIYVPPINAVPSINQRRTGTARRK